MPADGEIGFVVDSDKNAETGEQRLGLRDRSGRRQEVVHAPLGRHALGRGALDDRQGVLLRRRRLLSGSTARSSATRRRFDFYVEASKYAGDEVVATDVAPDGDAVWSYATVTKSYGLVRVADRSRSRRAARRAGKPFVVGYAVRPHGLARAGQRGEVDLRRDGRREADAGRVTQDAEVATCRVTVPKTLAAKTTSGSC